MQLQPIMTKEQREPMRRDRSPLIKRQTFYFSFGAAPSCANTQSVIFRFGGINSRFVLISQRAENYCAISSLYRSLPFG